MKRYLSTAVWIVGVLLIVTGSVWLGRMLKGGDDLHNQCIECEKWEYKKNLVEVPWYDEHYMKMNAILGKPYYNIWSSWRGNPETVLVHPACNLLEKCGCKNGWRVKKASRKPITI